MRRLLRSEYELREPGIGETILSPPVGLLQLLLEIVGLLQLSISQFTPNIFSLLHAYCTRMEDIDMPMIAEGFLFVFVVKRRGDEQFFCFQGVAQCKFIEHDSRWDGFEKRFFYLRDHDWGVPSAWGKSAMTHFQREHLKEIRDLYRVNGLFSFAIDFDLRTIRKGITIYVIACLHFWLAFFTLHSL